jgi:myo-inositol-1-phosphate synthase
MSQEIRVAFAGVGNCTSSLIQGLTYYRDLEDTEFVPGLMHPVLGSYRIRDIVPVAAFDIDARKVGHEPAEEILAPPNNTYKISDVAPLGVEVMMGPVLDGHPAHLQPFVRLAEREPVDVG